MSAYTGHFSLVTGCLLTGGFAFFVPPLQMHVLYYFLFSSAEVPDPISEVGSC